MNTRVSAFFAAAMLSAAIMQLGHVPSWLALLVSLCIGLAFCLSLSKATTP